jgi:hypothetical protein
MGWLHAYQRIVGVVAWLWYEDDGHFAGVVILEAGDVCMATVDAVLVVDIGCTWTATILATLFTRSQALSPGTWASFVSSSTPRPMVGNVVCQREK